MRFLFALLFFCNQLQAQQSCNVCPPGSTVGLNSTFPAGTTHQWTCTNGFTSTQRNPSISVNSTTTCTLLVTDAAGCTNTSSVVINVCDCSANTACITAAYNSNTGVLTATKTGTANSVATDVVEYRYLNPTTNAVVTPWTVKNAPLTFSGCDIKVGLNSFISYSVVGGNAVIMPGASNTNTCGDCSSTSIQLNFPLNSFSTSGTINCSSGTNFISRTMTPTDWAYSGAQANAYIQMTTPYGTVVDQHRITGNYSVPTWNLTTTRVAKREIFKKVELRRTVTFTNGCPPVVCTTTVDVPQQPPTACATLSGYLRSAALPAPCGAIGLSAEVFNGTPPYTYAWYKNGTPIPGENQKTLCRPAYNTGVFSVIVSDAAGCYFSDVQDFSTPGCNLVASIDATNLPYLTANQTGCVGSPTRVWEYWNNQTSTWSVLGTTGATLFATTSGTYRVTITCSGCVASATYNLVNTCNASVTLGASGTNLTASVFGCGGALTTYRLFKQINGSWVEQTVNSTTNSSYTFVGALNSTALYRVDINCSTCTASAQYSYVSPIVCNLGIVFTGTATPCRNSTTTYTAVPSGGTPPYSYSWVLNGNQVGTASTYNYTASANGSYSLMLTMRDANLCEVSYPRTITVSTCCAVSVSLTPSNPSACVNTLTTFTASASGGTPPYTYSWTVQKAPAAATSEGGGSIKYLAYGSTGLYTVSVTAQDALCSASASTNYNVTTCTDCTCQPFLVAVGCQLQASFAGSGCSGYSYQLQYSATGSGWATEQSGSAGVGFVFNPIYNGFYRLVIFKNGCSTAETAIINVNCVITCGCTTGVLTRSGCALTWAACSGYTSMLQIQNGANWDDVTQTQPYSLPVSEEFSYEGYTAGVYRVVYKKGACPDVISNQVTISLGEIVTFTEIDAYAFQLPNALAAPYHWISWGKLLDPGGSVKDYIFTSDAGVGEKVLYVPVGSGSPGRPWICYALAPGQTNLNCTLVGVSQRSYDNTFTSTVPVTWTITDFPGFNNCNYIIYSQTSTSLVLRIGAQIRCPIDNVPISNRFKFKITATDNCGRVVFKALALGVGLSS